ncbi:hypothetical protein [Streptomyces microflavus]|uniref:hypothetical protein n=1 Tax=Streptomyces microflavus TaxID=1919 RepID=UPI0036378FCF
MRGGSEDDDATTRAFLACCLHDVGTNAAKDGHPTLIEAAAERPEREQHGRLDGNTPQCVYGRAQQNA